MHWRRRHKTPRGLGWGARAIGAYAALVLAAASTGCDSAEPPIPSLVVADAREAELATVAEYLALPRFAAADFERGERVFLRCTVCHAVDREDGHRAAGPNLVGLFGRAAGSSPGFAYSPALRASGIVWTPATLDAWLAGPARLVRGNAMAFPGLTDRDERADLIAFLLQKNLF